MKGRLRNSFNQHFNSFKKIWKKKDEIHLRFQDDLNQFLNPPNNKLNEMKFQEDDKETELEEDEKWISSWINKSSRSSWFPLRQTPKLWFKLNEGNRRWTTTTTTKMPMKVNFKMPN